MLPTDQSTAVEWGTAADICANLTLGGYSDWFLPSTSALDLMYQNLKQDSLSGTSLGGFASNFYWSSTEVDNYNAWGQNFGNGSQYGSNKYYSNAVRAVRAF